MKPFISRILFLALPLLFVVGCASNKPNLEYENQLLKGQLDRLQKQHEDELNRLSRQKDRQVNALEQSRDELARQLADELADSKAKLELSERGLVVTFLQEIIFDSGKAEVKPEGIQVLSKVAAVVQNQAKGYPLVVEGHTDNVPIRVSGWKSNWELSAARALSVLHEFVDNEGIDPNRLAVMGYGEYKPVADNSTTEGRRQNRRVEIVIFPERIQKVKPQTA